MTKLEFDTLATGFIGTIEKEVADQWGTETRNNAGMAMVRRSNFDRAFYEGDESFIRSPFISGQERLDGQLEACIECAARSAVLSLRERYWSAALDVAISNPESLDSSWARLTNDWTSPMNDRYYGLSGSTPVKSWVTEPSEGGRLTKRNPEWKDATHFDDIYVQDGWLTDECINSARGHWRWVNAYDKDTNPDGMIGYFHGYFRSKLTLRASKVIRFRVPVITG